MDFDFSITDNNFLMPSFDLCERPIGKSDNESKDQPGRFVQGPEEKFGQFGFSFGLFRLVILFSSYLRCIVLLIKLSVIDSNPIETKK